MGIFKRTFFHFSAFSAAYGLKGCVWLVKYHRSKDKSIRRFFVPKELQNDPAKFERFLDRQSGEDSNFRIRSKVLWHDFVRFEEDRLHESGSSVRFSICESTGNVNPVVLFIFNNFITFRSPRYSCRFQGWDEQRL